MMKNSIKRIYTVLLAALLLMQVFVPCAYALEGVDTDAQASLELKFLPEGISSAQGVEFGIYRIADMDFTSEYILLEQYAAYDVSIDPDIDQSGWKDLATTLSAYITADGILPDKTAVTDEEGIAEFTELQVGLYLVIGEELNADRKIFTPDTFLVSVPGLDENEKWVYDVTAQVKYESRPDAEPVDVEVIKIWDDGEGESRPQSITVELYDDGTLYDTVVLDKTNDWSYCWKELYGGTTYTVIEKDVPEGYKVSIEKQQNVFVITNKGPEPPKEPELPYTGMLWWPVPVLFVAGIILTAAGYLKRRRELGEK